MREFWMGWGSLISGLLGLYFSVEFTIEESNSWSVLFLVLTVVGLCIAFVVDLRAHRARRPKVYDGPAAIDRYMLRWISQRGRVAIFTRDMSWAASQPAIKSKLLEKAQNDELEICLPERKEITDELAAVGAQVHAYGPPGFKPLSRFTIVRYGKIDAAVAIGRHVDGKHQIAEYTSERDPVLFSVVHDLVSIVARRD